ncbi:NTMT1 isoform 10 [Pongo abelii]|uniref:NTMT1 isoform 10 n=1 Tax=Pongo abelii TaxID=9601 RepID=A0A2J8UJH0_PONAB|nr:NTMT1 isoform 10 [Pongo abelii]
MTSEVIGDEKQFYSKAKTYWKQIPPTVDGMLGGKARTRQERPVPWTVELALGGSPSGCSCRCSERWIWST